MSPDIQCLLFLPLSPSWSNFLALKTVFTIYSKCCCQSPIPFGRRKGTKRPWELCCFLQRISLPLSLYFLALGNDRLQNQMLHRSFDNNLERWPLLACSVGFLFFPLEREVSYVCFQALKKDSYLHFHRYLILSGGRVTDPPEDQTAISVDVRTVSQDDSAFHLLWEFTW